MASETCTAPGASTVSQTLDSTAAACPTNDTLAMEQSCTLGLNTTAPCTMGYFCSEPEDAGELVVMVEFTEH